MKAPTEMSSRAPRRGANTLGPLAGLFLLTGLAVEAYLIITAMVNPTEASDFEGLDGGFALALFRFLLFYWLWPQNVLVEKQRRNEMVERRAPAYQEKEEEREEVLEAVVGD
jgi:hypothetical protein